VILEQVRQAIHNALPDADEVISYNIPTFKVGGRPVIYFAGWKSYISLYPVPPVDEATEKRLEPYRAAKSTLRFPLAKPLPYDLIGRLAGLAERRIKG
jgi:uncharacterized protein YdhG (YjbR/CyaY superfamily)